MVGDVKDLTELLNLAPAIVIALLAIVVAVKFGPRIRRLGHLIDDLAGEPARPGVKARPGVMARLQQVEDRTSELVRNSGSSMKDALDRLETRSLREQARGETLDRRLRRIELKVCRAPGGHDEGTP